MFTEAAHFAKKSEVVEICSLTTELSVIFTYNFPSVCLYLVTNRHCNRKELNHQILCSRLRTENKCGHQHGLAGTSCPLYEKSP
jgi:hypothetical protein